MKHRADIEGLRGISVLLVVLAHAGVPGLYGGFVGVDVFFVISGYLITGLLLGELRDTGRIDAWRFYARRVRRLLPAFAVMLLVTLALAAWLLSPPELARHAREAAWAAAWAANLFQVVADTDYFASTRDTGLFLHTWSLGVEEQFYLAWPLLLWLAWRLLGGRNTLLLLLFGLLLVGGFAYSLRVATGDGLAAYFLPQVRAWQFAAGALAFAIANGGRVPRGAVASTLVAAGLLAIAAGATSIERGTAYPGWAALAPTLGAAAVLLGGASGGGVASRALGSTGLAAIGRVSYSWYLWHWPALLFAALLAPGNIAIRVLAVVASLLVAWVVFRTIEDPLRRSRRGEPRTIALAGVLLSVLLAAGSFAVHRMQRAPIGPAAPPPHPIMAAATLPEIYAARCDRWYTSSKLVPCKFLLGGRSDRTAIVVGDSIGLQWFPALKAVFEAEDWDFVVLTKSACAIVDRPFVSDRTLREFTECAQWRATAAEYIRDEAPALVVMGSAGSYPFDTDAWREGSVDFLRSIAAPGRRIAVLGPTPVLPFDAPSCLMRDHDQLPQVPDLDECSVPLGEVAFAGVEAALREAVAQVSGAAYIDAATLACPEGRCAAWRGGQLAFRDNQHLNARYVESLAPGLAGLLAPSMVASDPVTP